MSNTVLLGQTASLHGWPLSAVPGTHLAGECPLTSPVRDRMVPDATLRMAKAGKVFRPQSALTNNNTTRIPAPYSGESGSPPTWDPV
ncbi:MAG TPA: hypothetical protein VGS19_11165 [Streptosporangiaceae bacterium]|nr:hypothetical protein [Streptosporangiaceae bacterium]